MSFCANSTKTAAKGTKPALQDYERTRWGGEGGLHFITSRNRGTQHSSASDGPGGSVPYSTPNHQPLTRRVINKGQPVAYMCTDRRCTFDIRARASNPKDAEHESCKSERAPGRNYQYFSRRGPSALATVLLYHHELVAIGKGTTAMEGCFDQGAAPETKLGRDSSVVTVT